MSFTILRSATVRAAKRHRCAWCGEGIEVGDTHVHEVSIFNCNFQDHRFHHECLDALHDDADDNGGEVEFEYQGNERPAPEQGGAAMTTAMLRLALERATQAPKDLKRRNEERKRQREQLARISKERATRRSR